MKFRDKEEKCNHVMDQQQHKNNIRPDLSNIDNWMSENV